VIVHVVRCFESGEITHVEGSVDPVRDVEIIETELMLADLDSVEKRIQKGVKVAKAGDKEAQAELVVVEKAKKALSDGKWLQRQTWTAEELTLLDGIHLLTQKSVLYVANVDDMSEGNPHVKKLKDLADSRHAPMLVLSAKMEEEILELPEEERATYLQDLGMTESGLHRLIRAGYDLLGLITFFTVGPKEVRAWTIPRGAKAPQAAGAIHSDFERGFICAETCSFEDFARLGSEAKARAAGVLRQEGKEYVVRDGDVMHFKFNV
jgi:GTP-binding protein YchF